MVGKTILVVDDSPVQLKMVCTVLAAQNYQLITAGDGEEALQQVVAHKPDLVILDVVMPKMDGFQACRKIKSSPAVKHIPVIMLTSKNQKVDEFWGKRQGADVYLTKPFEESVLLKEVATLLK